MIRTTAVPRPVRITTAVVGIAGAFALAGCTATDTAAETTPSSAPSAAQSITPEASATADAAAEGSGTYADGTYTAEGSYSTPESVETISVTITLADDVITAVEVTGDPQKAESERYQSEFIGGIDEVVVGQEIDSISVSRVAGSSLTSGGFNQAIEQITSQAAA